MKIRLKSPIFNGRDNVTSLRLFVDDKVINPQQLSKIEFIFDDIIIDTDNNSELFELTQYDINIKMGLAGFPQKRGKIDIIIYDTLTPNGIYFGQILAEIRD